MTYLDLLDEIYAIVENSDSIDDALDNLDDLRDELVTNEEALERDIYNTED